MEYKVKIKLGYEEMKVKVNAKSWEEVCEYVFGHIEVIPEDEEKIVDIDEE